MSSDGYIFFLDASSQLFNKLMIITSYNVIKMGGVIQGEITQLVLRIRDVITTFKNYRLHIFIWYVTLDVAKI